MIELLRAKLSHPLVYNGYQRLLGGRRFHQRIVAEHLRPMPGWSLLDLGCGTGEILLHLPAGVRYLGVDSSARYIEYARTHHGQGGRFLLRPVGAALTRELGRFNLVLACGLLHHLADHQARDLFALARTVLTDRGRLVTVDPCYVPDQARLARLAISRDRGRNVRTPAQYQELASTFSRLTVQVRHDLLRIPFTHLVMEVC